MDYSPAPASTGVPGPSRKGGRLCECHGARHDYKAALANPARQQRATGIVMLCDDCIQSCREGLPFPGTQPAAKGEGKKKAKAKKAKRRKGVRT